MTISVGIIGAGAIAREHISAFARIPGVAVRWIADRHPERAEALANSTTDARWTADADRLLEDPELDAVDICTSPDSHAAYAISTAEHGKAVHVEKPAALSVSDFDAMTRAASEHGVQLMVGQTARFQPVHLDLADEISSGTIGTPRVLHLTWYVGHVWPNGWRGWQLDQTRSGGHLVHNGVHAIDLAVWLLDSVPTRVYSRGLNTFASSMPTPDSFHITVRFDNGSLALLEISYALRERGERLRRALVIGEEGSLEHSTDSEPVLPASGGPMPPESLDRAMENQLSHWISSLRAGSPSMVRNDQVRATLATAIGAQRSLESGRAVELEAES